MIRVGLVGAGEWGRHLVGSVQHVSPALRFICVTTGRPERARPFAEQAQLDLLPDLDTVLARADVDAVVLATPHSQHAGQACRAAAAGKHVFVEKPMALTGADARRIASACLAAGVVCAVGFNRRFQPAARHLQALLDDGGIGGIVHLEGNFSGDTGYRYQGSGWRQDSPKVRLAG